MPPFVSYPKLVSKYDYVQKNLDFSGLYTPINRLYFQKHVIYGNYIDITTYSKIRLSYKNPTRSFTRKANPRTYRSISRTKETIYRLVHANIGSHGAYNPVFCTLTYKRNEKSLRAANRDFKYFIKKLRIEMQTSIAYVACPEFQRRGAVHYHIIFFNLPYVSKDIFESLWCHGYTNIQVAKKVGAVSSYLHKYLSKTVNDPRFINQRVILSSRNLIRPFLSFDHSQLEIYTSSAIIKELSGRRFQKKVQP